VVLHEPLAAQSFGGVTLCGRPRVLVDAA
jgi:hypothetical protein